MSTKACGRQDKAGCSVCQVPHSLRGDGRVYPHAADGVRCPGSQQHPVAVPRRMSADDYMAQYGPGGVLADA